MDEVEVRRNVTLYKWFVISAEPLFWGPTLILCLQHLGKMSLSEVYIMEAIVISGIIFLEIPSGALADLIGRKQTILLGNYFFLASSIMFAFINSAYDVWIANITAMVGIALRSGADSAFLYDSLKEVGRESEYKKIHGNAMGSRLLIVAFCSLGAGFLSEISLRIPLFISIPGIIASCVIVSFFKEPIHARKYNALEQMNLMKVSVLFVANHKEVKWIIGFATLITVVSKIWFFSYNPYFELVDFDLKYYGVVFFLLNIVAWFFSRYAYMLEKKIGEQYCVMMMVILIGLPILFMGSVVSQAMISMVLFQNVVRGFMDPFLGGFLNHHLDSENRATVISIKSAVSGFASVITLSLFGSVLKFYSLAICLQSLGIITLLFGIIAIWRYRRIFK
jgi:MFS family permease